MGYMHIDNLYKPQAQTVLLFKEVYALEKIHGTSAHLTWKDGDVRFSSGGCAHDLFVSLFDIQALRGGFEKLGHPGVTVFGEQYGGKQQGMAKRYGVQSRFVAFEVLIGEKWLAVPDAAHVVENVLGLEFVHYLLVPAIVASLDRERDAPSEQARRNGVEGDQPREGIVIRPPIEVIMNNGRRVIAKHKRADERETKTPRDVSPEALAVLTAARAIADEWVTPMRLTHVLDHLAARGEAATGPEHTRAVIQEMLSDVLREASGEIVESDAARREICKAAASVFHQHLRQALEREEAT